jgi:dihydroxyacetone kinase
MKIVLGGDPLGVNLKHELVSLLRERRIEFEDFGVSAGEAADRPDIAEKVAYAVRDGRFECGILICGTGIGMAITANKVPGISAAVAHDPYSADEITDQLVDRIFEDGIFRSGDEVAVLVNGLGATPLAELFIVFRRAAQRLNDAGIRIHRSYVGEYSTSLEMAGCSLTLMRLDDEPRRWVDAPASSPYFTQAD